MSASFTRCIFDHSADFYLIANIITCFVVYYIFNTPVGLKQFWHILFRLTCCIFEGFLQVKLLMAGMMAYTVFVFFCLCACHLKVVNMGIKVLPRCFFDIGISNVLGENTFCDSVRENVYLVNITNIV